MVSLGIGNTRMKDYFDLWILARHSRCGQKFIYLYLNFLFWIFGASSSRRRGGEVVSRANQRVFHREVLRTPSHSNSIDEVRCYRLETVRFFKVPDNSIVRFEAFQSASFDNATAATSLRRCP